MTHRLTFAALVCLIALPAMATEPVAKMSRSFGPVEEEEIRLYLSDGTHKNATQNRLPVTVRVTISGDRPLTEAEEDEVRAAALVCETGYVLDVSEERDGDRWTFQFFCVTPGRALP